MPEPPLPPRIERMKPGFTGIPVPEALDLRRLLGVPWSPPQVTFPPIQPRLGMEPGAPTQAPAQAPTAPPQAPPAQAPAAPTEGPGGWIEFGPGFAQPGRFGVERGEPRAPGPTPEVMAQLRANPIKVIGAVELAMGQAGQYTESQKQSVRTTLAGWMVDADVNPGAAAIYMAQGARGLPDMGKFLAADHQQKLYLNRQLEYLQERQRYETRGTLATVLTDSQAKQKYAHFKDTLKLHGVRTILRDGSRLDEILRPGIFGTARTGKTRELESLSDMELLNSDRFGIIDRRVQQGGRGALSTQQGAGRGAVRPEVSGAVDAVLRRRAR